MQTETSHEIQSLCPICAKVSSLGMVEMAGQEVKYICPMCGGRHYGEPEQGSMGSYVCMKCAEATPSGSWKEVPMSKGEIVNGPIKACGTCQSKLGEEYVALIETKDETEGGNDNRTGNIYFVIPPKEFVEQLNGDRSAFMSESMIRKIKE